MEINETENRKTRKNQQNQKEKNQIMKSRRRRDDFTTNLTEIKRISREYNEQVYAKKNY